MDISAAVSQPLNLLSAAAPSSPIRRRLAFSAARAPGAGAVRCSTSKVKVKIDVKAENEKRPALKWDSLYREISTTAGTGTSPTAVIDRWEVEERRLPKKDLSRAARELRKFGRHHLALEIYDWMTAQGNRFSFNSSDLAIKLDLIAKVRGVPSAEEHFSSIPDTLKDKRTYGALLNAYGQAKLKEKAETTLELMRNKGYVTDALPFNVIMTLYMNLGEHEKVSEIINEMKEKNVAYDAFSYNIWMTNCAALENIDEMERVMEKMTSDSSINVNWTTHTTLATMYIKLSNYEKAYGCLKEAETNMTSKDRPAFNYLLGLYGSLGKKEEVHQVWNRYKSSFPVMLNSGYQSMISSLLKMGEIEEAEAIYDEWVATTSHYDPRICHLLLAWYCREGFAEKAEGVLDILLKKGAKPKPGTWEILAEGYIKEKHILKALSCIREAASCESARKWQPKPANVANLLVLCEKQNDIASTDTLADILQTIGCLENEEYKELFSASAITSEQS